MASQVAASQFANAPCGHKFVLRKPLAKVTASKCADCGKDVYSHSREEVADADVLIILDVVADSRASTIIERELLVGGFKSALAECGRQPLTVCLNVAGKKLHELLPKTRLPFNELRGQGRMLDVEWEDSAAFQLEPDSLITAVQWASEQVRCGKAVLISCAQGRSRSGAMAMAYLMWRDDIDADEALRRVQCKRPFVSPNPGFLQQLRSMAPMIRSRGALSGSREAAVPVSPRQKDNEEKATVAPAVQSEFYEHENDGQVFENVVAAPLPPPPELHEQSHPTIEQADLQRLATLRLGPTTLVFASGSVLKYRGDAFVNAANEGCTGGFGVDELVNQSGGPELKKARKELGGCATGDAKVTPSFLHTYTAWIVHAVGPVYRVNPLKTGFDDTSACVGPYLRSLDHLLVAAHLAALNRARVVGARSIGFCMLSAGVFRGARSLMDIIQINARTLTHSILKEPSSFDVVHLIAYTPEERDTLQIVGVELLKELEQGGDGSDHDLVRGLLR